MKNRKFAKTARRTEEVTTPMKRAATLFPMVHESCNFVPVSCFDPLSVARTVMSTADAVDRAGSRKAATAESSRTKQIERCAADQSKEHEIPRRFMGFLLTFVHYAWRNRLAKFRRRVRAGGRQRATGARKTTKYNFAKRASQRTNGGSTES